MKALEKDAKGILTCQNRSNKESYEEDGNWMRDKNRRDMESSNASVIPEKIGRHQHGSDKF